MLQAALPCLLYAAPDASWQPPSASVLELRGGTDAAMAPSISYLQHMLLPTLRRLFGLTLDLQVTYMLDFSIRKQITLTAQAPSVDDLHPSPPAMLRRLIGLGILQFLALHWLGFNPK